MSRIKRSGNVGILARNVSIVFANNVITLLKGLLVSFALPKILSMPEYSEFKIFSLYITYVGLFHFGLVDGICVKFAGKSSTQIGEARIRMYTRLLLLLEVGVSLILAAAAGILVNRSYFTIVLFVAAYAVIHNMHAYFLSMLQITMQFKKYAYSGVFNNVLQLLAVFILWIIAKFDMPTGQAYIVLFLFGELITLLYVVLQVPAMAIGTAEKIRDHIDEIRSILAVGIPLLVAGIVATLVLNIDRQFVSALYSKEDYAIYAFTYSIMHLITTLISALSIVLYPSLKRTDENTMRSSYGVLCLGIAVLIFGVFAFSPVLGAFIRWFLPQYEYSLVILDCIFPSIATISILQIVIVNYYKALEKTTWYLGVSLGALMVSFLLNVMAQQLWGRMEAIALMTVIACFLWYLLGDYVIMKTMDVKKGARFYVFAMTMAYIVLSLFAKFEKPWIADVLYGIAYILCSCITLYKWKKPSDKNV